jgi:glutathione S-transferase
VQFLADQKPTSGLMPAVGTIDRYGVQEWLNFVASELHKTYSPMFRPTTPEEFKTMSRENIGKRLDWVDKELAGKQYITGEKFTAARICSRYCAGRHASAST